MQKRQASSFYPHFAENEKAEVDKFVGFFNRLLYGQEQLLTDFLDPGQRDILKTIMGHEIMVQEFGGWDQAEKKRVYLSRDWQNLLLTDYQVQPLAINYPQKFSQLTHSAILGSLANAGINLATFGDIITDGAGNWQVMVKKELTDFFTEQINRIGRVAVQLKPIPFTQVLTPVDDSQEITVVVSSLRLDNVLAKAARTSRGQIKQATAAGLVKLNWHQVTDSNIIMKVTDLASLRHFGRLQLLSLSATKKGKYRVVLKLWQTKRRNIKN